MNGTNLAGATSSTLTISNLSLANAGTYTIIIVGALGTVSASTVLSVLDLKMYAGLNIAGSIGSMYRVEFKDNLNTTNWTTLTNLTLSTPNTFFVDPNSPQHPSRFYRAVPLP